MLDFSSAYRACLLRPESLVSRLGSRLFPPLNQVFSFLNPRPPSRFPTSPDEGSCLRPSIARLLRLTAPPRLGSRGADPARASTAATAPRRRTWPAGGTRRSATTTWSRARSGSARSARSWSARITTSRDRTTGRPWPATTGLAARRSTARRTAPAWGSSCRTTA